MRALTRLCESVATPGAGVRGRETQGRQSPRPIVLGDWAGLRGTLASGRCSLNFLA